MNYILPLAIIVTFCFDYQNDVFWPPWVALAFICSSLATWRIVTSIKKPVPATIGTLFGWVTANAIAFMAWRPLTQGLDFDQKAAIRLCAAQTGLEVILIVGIFYTQWHRIRRPIALGLFFGGLLHALFLIFDQLAPMLFPSLPETLFGTKGLLGNRSIGATFTCIWFFFALDFGIQQSITSKKCLLWWAAPFIAIPAVLISVSSISFGSMILAAFCTILAAFCKVYRPWNALMWASLVGAACLAIGVIAGPHIDSQWGQHISRQDAWPMFYNWYAQNINLWLGSGAGSFKFYGPFIQDHEKYMVGRWWLWAHNDWLQILLEYGRIGLTLSIATFAILLKKSFDRPLIFGAIVCYGATMAGNYITHIAMGALIGCWLVFEVLWGECENSKFSSN